MEQKPFLLIDADVFVYQACAAVERVVCWEDDVCFPVASRAEALSTFDYKLSEVCSALDTNDYALCFSDGIQNNFRRKLYPGYKSNRKGKARPVALHFVREDLLRKSEAFFYPGIEADDVLGILSTSQGFHPNRKKIIVSVDKDMKTIPGYFYDVNKPDEGVQYITEEAADWWFMRQTLTGDSTDGYGGCPKIGPVNAEKLLRGLTNLKTMWGAVVAAYEKAGFSEDYALTMARLARILRQEDFDFKTREVKLWKQP